MATYTNQILVYVNGKNVKIGASDDLVIGGGFTAASFSGSGANLTSLNASNISSGTLSDARLSSNVALYDAAAPNFTNTVTAAAFSGNGSALTSLNASNLSSGTVADARLSANVPLLNASNNNFTGDMRIGGDLTVAGSIFSTTPSSVLVGDNFIDLLAGNTSTVAPQAGGFTVTVQAQGSSVTGTAFVAGVAGVSNPYVTTSTDPSGTFNAGDIINITGSTDGKNDGQYVVLSATASPNRVTVKGIGTTAPSAQVPFAHNQFVAQTSQTATIIKANVSVVAASNGTMASASGAIPAGTVAWAYANTEAGFTGGWTSLASVTPTLQSAYNGGPTITLTNGNDLVVSKPSSGTAAISLGANAASDITIDGADLDLSADHVNLNGPAIFASAGAVSGTTTGLAAGDICYFNSSGAAAKSDNATNTNVDGVVLDSGHIASVFGTPVVVKYTGSAPAQGDTLWLSATAGQGTATLPTSGDIVNLGRVIVAGAGGVCTVIWKPQYIATV